LYFSSNSFKTLESFIKDASAETKIRMLEWLSSNHELSDGSIGFKIKKPFDFSGQTASYKTWYSQVDDFRTECLGLMDNQQLS
jgi:hypothetical protein